MPATDRLEWPLRLQIMVPMTLLMLVTVIGLSGFHIYLSASRQLAVTERQIHSIARTLEQSSFPLTDGVLQQMKGLSGAEFVVVDTRGEVQATTERDWASIRFPNPESSPHTAELQFSDTTQIVGESFYHATFPLRPRGSSSQKNVLHILYSQDLFARQRRATILPSLVIGSLALIVVAGAAIAIGSRVTRPLSGLGEQVARISKGNFEPMPLPPTKDEVRQLSVAVNEMAEMLTNYEQAIRRTEQVRTLGQLGGALAHQLRNSATGARLALDIHRSECHDGGQSESLEVGRRQLVLMERYIQRFLKLGSRQARSPERLNFVELIEDLLPLLSPAAKHAGVELEADLPESMWMMGERDGLEHLVLNLLLNGIEAAATADPSTRRVRAVLRANEQLLSLTVEDNGAGPASDIATSLFESFVTNKPNGVGLGLAIAKQVTTDHHGVITWERADGTTTFRVELPLSPNPDSPAGSTGAATSNEGGLSCRSCS